ncbi:MAG: HIT family protein [Patescibacteria group bacterium]
MDCIFCQIIAKKIPAKIIYEDEKYISILDINPNTRGHALVIPKEHVADFTSLTDEQAADFVKIVHRLAPQIIDILGVRGYNLGLNNGRVAGQLVDHVHWHIIPRWDDDGLVHWSCSQAAKDDLEQTFAKLQGKIK